MRVISTRTHGVIDYVMSIIIMGSPWLMEFALNRAETWVPVIVGIAGLVYSICTNYELGLVKAISMRTHLALDFVSGVLLALSPWIFGFASYIYLPHLILGIIEIGAAVVTERSPHSAARETAHTTRTAH